MSKPDIWPARLVVAYALKWGGNLYHVRHELLSRKDHGAVRFSSHYQEAEKVSYPEREVPLRAVSEICARVRAYQRAKMRWAEADAERQEWI